MLLPLLGSAIAFRDDGVLNWILSDHLGSTSISAHADGSWRGEIAYTPFGETRTSRGMTLTDYRYTGQRQDGEVGLYFYQSRWMDPYLNQWIQPDTIIPEIGNPLDMNRYSYVRYNPVRFTDPSGHCPWCVATAFVGAAVSVGLYSWNVKRSGQEWNACEALTVAAIGAGAGALIGTGIGAGVGTAAFSAIATSAGVGMGSSVAGHMVMNGVTRTEFETGDIVISAAVGLGTGALGQAGVATNIIGSIGLEGAAGVIQYGATEISHGRYPTLEGVAWAGAIGMVSGGISGPATAIDDLTRRGVSNIGFNLDNPDFRVMLQSALFEDVTTNAGRTGAVSLLSNLPQPD